MKSTVSKKIFSLFPVLFFLLAPFHPLFSDWTTSDRYSYFSRLENGQKTGLWSIRDSMGSEILVFSKQVGYADKNKIIELLNLQFDPAFNPGIEYVGRDCSTVRVRVIDGMKLSEQMGSTGAAAYMAIVTYSLSSLDDIDFVYFEMEEGTHARPGRYGRMSFYRFWPL
ncbi:hypothetical protein CHISP_3317 [Chitinispirillum alkaliphilum]|nr:hypothetical protein CHISP_3317 [Chitinispirillum alkaliphilum]